MATRIMCQSHKLYHAVMDADTRQAAGRDTQNCFFMANNNFMAS